MTSEDQTFGRTSQDLMQQLLDEALADGLIEIVGENEDGKTLYRGAQR